MIMDFSKVNATNKWPSPKQQCLDTGFQSIWIIISCLTVHLTEVNTV